MRLMRLVKPRSPAQALVEFVLVFPLFLLLLMSVIVFGIYLFYNQQLANAAREAARFAAVNTSTAQCPIVSQLDPISDLRPQSGSYNRCDAPENGWPKLTAAARSKIWGMAPTMVSLTACWSGYINPSTLQRDLRPDATGAVFRDCTIGGVDPQTSPSSLACPAPVTTPSGTPNRETAPADGDDKASAIAVAAGSTGADTHYPTTVTVYACFNWKPPMAGFVLIPSQVTIRGVVTETLQRQQ